MRKAVVQTEFLCSYYYHAARDAADRALKHKLPESLQNGITSLILSQCALESYINFMILSRNRDAVMVKVFDFATKESVDRKLLKVSIRDKWIHFPIVENNTHFKQNAEPFKCFTELIGHRNDLVHFNSDKLRFEKELPPGIAKAGDIIEYTKDGSWWAGSKLDRMFRIGIAGPLIIRDMIQHLHHMLDTPPPAFLAGDKIFFSIKIEGEDDCQQPPERDK